MGVKSIRVMVEGKERECCERGKFVRVMGVVEGVVVRRKREMSVLSRVARGGLEESRGQRREFRGRLGLRDPR